MPDSTTVAETRDTKLEIIMGRPALNKLAAATVLVLGCGGVGSNCIEALARGGVGHFIILDKDIVAPSNINRQAIAFHELGTASFMPPIMGQMIAGEVIRRISGVGCEQVRPDGAVIG